MGILVQRHSCDIKHYLPVASDFKTRTQSLARQNLASSVAALEQLKSDYVRFSLVQSCHILAPLNQS
jgi:hypothetical protein